MKFHCLLLLAWSVAIALSSGCASQHEPSSTIGQAVDAILADKISDDRPGATIGIIKDGQLIFAKGYGMADIESHFPNSPEVLYNVASVSKQFTATVVASLIAQDKLALSDSIGEYIPEIPSYGKSITIENLLYHTSGIRDYMVLMWLTGKSFEEPLGNKDAVDIIVRQNKLNFRPGERCVYSNSNYVLLAEIIHRTTGKRLSEYARLNLLKNLDMNSSGFGDNEAVDVVHATSYRKSGENYLPCGNDFSVHGDGGLRATLNDLVRWDKEFYVPSSMVQPILKRGRLSNGNVLSYGMGIMFETYRGETIQTHPGAFLGFRAEMLRFPHKEISIVCLGNTDEIDPEEITRAIADVVVFGDKLPTRTGPKTSATKTETRQLTAEQAAALVGTYEVASNVLVHVRYEDGLLTGQLTGQPRQALSFEGDAKFKIATTDDQAAFADMNDGKYQQLTVIQKEGSTTARRLVVLPTESHGLFEGSYYSQEQDATYQIYSRDGSLWFKVGSNAEVAADILMKYNQLYFSYENLEQATIDFQFDGTTNVTGFKLNSGRVQDIEFAKL